MSAARRRALAVTTLALLTMVSLGATQPLVPMPTPEQTGALLAAEQSLTLLAGQTVPLTFQYLKRVAVADPNIADIVVVSEHELLLQAGQDGTTDLIVWDAQGQHRWTIVVRDVRPEQLQAELTRLLADEGFDQLTIRRERNQLFVSGSVSSQGEVDRLTKLLEPYPGVIHLVTIEEGMVPLVELEVQVIELTKDFTNSFGVDWLSSDQITVTETAPAAKALDASVVSRVGEIFRIGSLSRSGFNAVINFAFDTGKARLLAAPNLTTSSGKPAKSHIGGEVPIVASRTTGTGSGTTEVEIELKEVGVILTMTPTVSSDRERITTKLTAEVTTIDLATGLTISGIVTPGFKVRKAETEVMSGAEETIIIAGLIQNEESAAFDKVPGMSKIPVLGHLFKSTAFQLNQTELVITVTPRLVETYKKKTPGTGAMASTPVPRPPPQVSIGNGRPSMDPLTAYSRQVQERIAAGLQETLPAVESGTVRVQLHLLASGELKDVQVSQSSGKLALDQAALAAIEVQAPYPAFPPSLSQPELRLDVPIIFQDRMVK